MKLPEVTLKKVIGIVLLCLIVGFVMKKLGIAPDNFWRWMLRLGEGVINAVQALFANGLEYLLIGAAVVLPIYAIVFLTKLLRRRS